MSASVKDRIAAEFARHEPAVVELSRRIRRSPSRSTGPRLPSSSC
jgi:hypothetical protein